jgi:hypothetical protein
MKNKGILIIIILIISISVISLFVIKSSAAQDSVYIEGCSPYNIEIKKGDILGSVVISWKSKEKCSAYLLYGKEADGLDMVGVDLKNDIKSKEHIVTIENLVSTKIYYFVIVSNDVIYGKNGLPLQFSIDSL